MKTKRKKDPDTKKYTFTRIEFAGSIEWWINGFHN
jgi:hypothetical protein